jgi:hypothetical protein
MRTPGRVIMDFIVRDIGDHDYINELFENDKGTLRSYEIGFNVLLFFFVALVVSLTLDFLGIL